MPYTFDPIFAVDPGNPANVAANAELVIFTPGDTSLTPLSLTTPDGLPFANPVTTNGSGFAGAFVHETLGRVAWAGGGFTGFFTAHDSLKEEAVAAKDSAAASANSSAVSAQAAQDAAALVDAPADQIMADTAANPASAFAGQLSATYGRVLRPEMFGAVGDGVADDLPAFQDMAATMLADVQRPWRIEITRTHYVSNSINFDAEDIELHLADAAHVFTTAATNRGHTIGFIGHDGLGTAISPQRRRCSITGTGRVTGWVGTSDGTTANNENAIGIVRYQDTFVDGPTRLVAGNKAITAQYGIGNVHIGTLHVSRADLHAVAIEAASGTVKVESLRVDQCGGSAAVLQGEHVRVGTISVGQAMLQGKFPSSPYNPAPANPVAVVRAGGASTKTASMHRVEIGSAGQGRGISMSNTTELVHLGSAYVGASVEPAVFVLDVSAPTIIIGALEAPASPKPLVTAAGTTSAASIRRFGQTEPTEVAITATRFSAVVGSPAVGMAGAQLPGFLLDQATTEAVAVILGRDTIPASWNTFAVDIIWTNTTTNAGNVRHNASYGWLGDGDAFSTGTFVSGTAQAAPVVFGTLKVTRLITSVTADAAKSLYLRVIRAGDDATDTLPNDSGLVAVKLVRLS